MAAAVAVSPVTAVTPSTDANILITNHKKDIQKISDELRSKNDMLTSLLDLAHQQSMHNASLKGAVEDTVHWDPDISPRPSSSSTPKLL